MAEKPRIVFLTGGPEHCHPVSQQLPLVKQWLGDGYLYEEHDGLPVFDSLDRCDLFVAIGMHFPRMSEEWAGNMTYRPIGPEHLQAFERYVSSGRPVLVFHGGSCNYNDTPRFGELMGFMWEEGYTYHSHVMEYPVKVRQTGHPIVQGVTDYTVTDELYCNPRMADTLQEVVVHAVAEWDGKEQPMIVTARGGRMEGSGRTAFLANGHNMKTFECEMMPLLWRNAVRWLLS